MAIQVNISLMKEDILESGTKFQIGVVPGHRVEEHLIVFKIIIQMYMQRKSGVIMQLVDIQNFLILRS